jgi:2'-5' RNA ligase
VLFRSGIEKVFTLQQMPAELLQNVLGDNGIVIWKKANGIDNSPVEPYSERKSLSSEETFDRDTIDVAMLKSLLIRMTEKLAFQLRSEEKLTSCVTVKIRYSNFDTHTMQCRIPYTSCDHTLMARVKELFDKLYSRRMLIRLVGIKFSHLVGGGHQINLFEDSEHIISLYQAMDRLRRVYGAHAIERAVGTAHSLRAFNPFNGVTSAPAGNLPKDNTACEYLLLLNPPSAIKEEVWNIKKEFHRNYNHTAAVKSAPHITLANFWLNDRQEDDVVRKIDEVNQHQFPVEAVLENFSHFGTHTIYIDVLRPSGIIRLVKSLREKLGLHGSQSFFPMKPCMIIARGLREETFRKAIPGFQQREFSATFIADSMLLLKKESGDSGYRVIREFDFCCVENSDAAPY